MLFLAQKHKFKKNWNFFSDFSQFFFQKMGKIKKGWGNDFNFFPKFYLKKTYLVRFFRQSQSVWVQV